MNRRRSPVGEYDVPLPLWDDEPTVASTDSQPSPRLNQHGALESIVDAPRGASISLANRALALEDIMSSYNQSNKNRGAKASPGALQERYGVRGGHEVSTNMDAKGRMLARIANRAFDSLTVHDDMVAAGFEADDISYAREEIEQYMKFEYGPGKTYAPERNKLVKKAKKAVPPNYKA